jgi:hypothetical protein
VKKFTGEVAGIAPWSCSGWQIPVSYPKGFTVRLSIYVLLPIVLPGK